MMGEIADGIRKVQEIIGEPQYWVQGDAQIGNRFCLWGAVMELPVTARKVDFFLDEVWVDVAAVSIPDTDIHNPALRSYISFNDTSSYDDVMLFLATALDIAEQEDL